MLLRALYWTFRIPCVEQRHTPRCTGRRVRMAEGHYIETSCDCVRRLRRIRLREVLLGLPAHQFGGAAQ